MPTIAKTATAPEMPESLAALLPKIRRKPLPLTRNGKTVVYAVSARAYQKMREQLEFLSNYDGELTPEEERKLLRQVEEARKEKPLSAEESEKLMRRIANLKV